MIFFGTKGKVVAGEMVQGIQCSTCQSSQHSSFGILRYFHLYWIPTFLTSKKVGVECMHCKRVLVDDEVPSHLVDQIKSGIFTTGNTLPMFSGLFVIGLIVLGFVFAGQQADARDASYISQPAVNDYYIVDLTKIYVEVDAKYPYGLMRVTNVTSDRIEMQVGSMVYNMTSGVRQDIRDGKAAADTYYDPEVFLFELAELQGLKDTGVIRSIER